MAAHKPQPLRHLTCPLITEALAFRPGVRDIVGAFRDRLDNVDPQLVASWANTNQDEDLAGETPAQWLRTGRDSDQLSRAPERAA